MTTKVKDLLVSTPQGASGHLLRESQYVFNYDRDARREAEISLTMPLRAQSYSSNALHPIFTMNRPEGWLEYELARRMAKFGHVDDMRLLSIIGTKQIGRLDLREPDAQVTPTRPQVKLQEILDSSASGQMFSMLADLYLESGISGVQPKVMIPDAALAVDIRATVAQPNLIVKSGGGQYPGLAQNEFLCMDAARRSELDVPNFWLSRDGGIFVMERFDLGPEQDSGGREHLGFEDMAVLMGKTADTFGNYKYEGSYENIAKAVQIFCGAAANASLEALFASVALSVMVRNGDAHLKNFGLLYEYPGAPVPPRLAPVYDVVTTTVYEHEDRRTGRLVADRTLAIKLAKSKSYPTREQMIRFGRDACRVAHPEQIIERIADGMMEALRENMGRVEQELCSRMQREWDAGRMSMQPDHVFVQHAHAASADIDSSETPGMGM